MKPKESILIKITTISNKIITQNLIKQATANNSFIAHINISNFNSAARFNTENCFIEFLAFSYMAAAKFCFRKRGM